MAQDLSQFSLAGNTALITGGTRGIGQAVALGLAEAGADVVLIQRSDKDTATRDAIRKLGRNAEIVVADLANTGNGELSKLVEDVSRTHQVRILVNCAGIQRRHPVTEFPDKDFDEVMQVNLKATFQLSRDVARLMKSLPPDPATGRRGSIINFASLISFQGGLTIPAYAASKGAVMQLTKSFANELTSLGVTVNAIAPGYIETDMNEAILHDPARLASINARIPAGKWGKPEDFKGPAVFLASKAGAYVSGHTLVVDGGWMGR